MKNYGFLMLALLLISCGGDSSSSSDSTTPQTSSQPIYVSNVGNGSGKSWEDTTSIKKALVQAKKGDVVYLRSGEYDLDSKLNISSGVKLYGGFSQNKANKDLEKRDLKNNKTILNANQNQIIAASSLEKVVLDGLIFKNAKGVDGGAIHLTNAKNITLKNVAFLSNNAENGAGIYLSKSSEIKIQNAIFKNNRSSQRGGGISVSESSTQLNNVTFVDNNASNSGGAVNNWKSSIVITDSNFTHNLASSGGGGLFSYNNSNATITNTTFQDNNVSGSGITHAGAVYSSRSKLKITSCVFKDNNVSGSSGIGAAVHNADAQDLVVIKNSQFIGNKANGGTGGGVDNFDSKMLIEDCNFTKNYAYSGGAVSNTKQKLTLKRVIIKDSEADHWGGALFNDSGTGSEIVNSIIIKNKAYSGSGIYSRSANLKVINSTLVENGGWAIYNSSSSADIYNTIIWNNGIIEFEKAPFNVYNSSDSNTKLAKCIINNTTNSKGGSGTITDITTQINTDPNLAFNANGTYSFNSSSPAYNAGDGDKITEMADLLGKKRKQGVIDIGAIELQQ